MNKRPKVLPVIAGALGIVLAVSACGGGESGPISDVPEDIQALIADPPDVGCVQLAEKYKLPVKDGQVVLTFIPNEVKQGAAGKRQWSDAVNIPLDPVEKERFMASICTQPEMAGMVGDALANHIKVGDVSLRELNGGLLDQFADTTPQKWAESVLLTESRSYEDATRTMSELAGLVSVFDVTGPIDADVSWNYVAKAGAVTTKDQIRPITLSDRGYRGNFLVFSLTEKGQEGCWSRFGVNTGDQRVAGMPCEKPAPPPQGEGGSPPPGTHDVPPSGTGGSPPPPRTTEEPPPPPETTTQPPPSTGKNSADQPRHDGGRGTITAPAAPPAAGAPPAVRPAPQPAPPPAPVPSATRVPTPAPALPPATGAAPTTAPGTSTSCPRGNPDC